VEPGTKKMVPTLHDTEAALAGQRSCPRHRSTWTMPEPLQLHIWTAVLPGSDASGKVRRVPGSQEHSRVSILRQDGEMMSSRPDRRSVQRKCGTSAELAVAIAVAAHGKWESRRHRRAAPACAPARWTGPGTRSWQVLSSRSSP